MDLGSLENMGYPGISLPLARLVSSMPEPAAKLVPDALDLLVRRIAAAGDGTSADTEAGSEDIGSGKNEARLTRVIDSFMRRGFSHFEQYGPIVRDVIVATGGLSDGVPRNLSQTARMLGISLQKVKNAQSLFWESLLEEARCPLRRSSKGRKKKLLAVAKARAARRWFLASFLGLIVARSGSLVVDESGESPMQVAKLRFLARCSGVAYTKLGGNPNSPKSRAEASSRDFTRTGQDKRGLALLGPVGTIKESASIESPGAVSPDDLDPVKVSEWLGGREPGLVPGDLQRIAGWICARRAEKLTRVQKVILAMKRVGRPAHYSEITEVYKTLFPQDDISAGSIHSCLLRGSAAGPESEIVWAGGKGVFALRQWGYARPEKPLAVEAFEVVTEKYAETRRPVPLTLIAAELGAKRAVVKRSSLLSALFGNPAVKYLGGELFVPADEETGGEAGLTGGFGDSGILPMPSSAHHGRSLAPSGNQSTTGGQNHRELEDESATPGEDVPQKSYAYVVEFLDRALREFERRKMPRGAKKKGNM